MGEQEQGRRGASVWIIVGTTLIVLTLLGGVALICLVGGVGLGALTFRTSASPPPITPVTAPGGPASPTPSIVSAPPPAPPPAAPARPTAADIASLEPDRWHTIKAEPPTPLPAFDAFAGVPWALELARAWKPDAELHRMYLSDVKLDGTLDLVNDPDADADYRFYSPELVVVAKKAQAVSDDTVYSGFRVWVNEGEVKVMITDGTFTDPPMKGGRIDPALKTWQGFKPGCTPADLIRLARANDRYDKRPKYDMFLRDNGTRPFSISLTPGGSYDPARCE